MKKAGFYPRAAIGVLFFSLCFLSVVGLGQASAADWPCWRGSNQDGISRETDLLKEWPKNGPPLTWKSSKIGNSTNGMIVVEPMLYTIGQRGGTECALCISTASGKALWSMPIGKEWKAASSYYPIMRSTPTFYKGMLYAFSSVGNLVCIDTESARVVWTRNAVTTMGGQMPAGGYAESPYIDGKWVVICPGGPKCSMIAINRNDGKNVWTANAGMEAGYTSLVKASFGREHQYVSFSGDGVYGVKVRGGNVRWRYDKVVNESGTSVANLVWFGQTILASSTEGTGVFWVQREGKTNRLEEIWLNKELQIPTGDIVKVNDFAFACTPEDGLVCFNYKTGEVQWTDASLFPTPEQDKATKRVRSKASGASKDASGAEKPKEAPKPADSASLREMVTFLAQDNPLNALAESTAEETKDIKKADSDDSDAVEKEGGTKTEKKATRTRARKSDDKEGKPAKKAKKRRSEKKAKPPKAPRCMASMTYADGMLYVHTSSGALALIEANPKAFRCHGLIRISKKKALRPSPVVANGHLYVRDGETVYCFDVRQSTADAAASEAKKAEDKAKKGGGKALPGMPKSDGEAKRTAPTRG